MIEGQNAVAPSLCFASWSSVSNQTNFSSKFHVFNLKLRKRLGMQVPPKYKEFKGELKKILCMENLYKSIAVNKVEVASIRVIIFKSIV